ncbi:hypothetical protein HMN09_00547000 [Mycena chlorophos]|uniref:Uncharacterized protein n=1 Tax=Mycena chlorophos TaxID=658473 RepID=A0A8H6WER1_MYCCL|nr:hypothetical protein HMN09_00547000 [Mycena chlorophos]
MLALLLLAPIGALAQCYPSFGGVPVSIISSGGGIEWAVPSHTAGTLLQRNLDPPPLNKTGEWYAEQNGQWPPQYFVKDVKDTNLVVAPAESGLLFVDTIATSQNDQQQMWAMTCASCNPAAASDPKGGELAQGCQIKNAKTGLCARAEPAGTNYGTGTCEESGALQTFDFWAPTSS